MNAIRQRLSRGPARHATGVVASLASVAAATGAIALLESFAPVLSLGALYVLAVLPVAVFWGLGYAFPVAVASMLAFNWFFLPPRHTFALSDSQNWVALAVYLVTAVVVSQLASRSRRKADEARRREREASLLAEVSAILLESEEVQPQLRPIAALVAPVFGANQGTIELGSLRRAEEGEKALELVVAGHQVGRLFLRTSVDPDPRVGGRLLPALASLLAVATERERLARAAVEAETLRRSDAVKTAILRAVSHDLRSPLTAIRAAGEGLSSESLELGPADREALLATIRHEARRLERLVADLLDFSRLEVGAATPRPELWTADALVARALEALGAPSERILASVPDDLPPIRVDGTQVERVLVNVLENALKFSAPEDPVVLTVGLEATEVFIRVADRGPGLRPDDLERIFEPFERGPNASASRGAGLGLPIARGFAQANGGRLWAEPGTDGGATFVLALPGAETPAKVLA